MDIKKITFLTGHNWKSNRLGGFHKFAEACCNQGIETVFFSFPRPYYAYFMHQELFNKESIKSLSEGIEFTVGKSRLLNITLPTFKLPNFANKFISDELMNSFERLSLGSFRKFAKKYFSDTDVFVFESCDGIIYFDILKKLFPCAKMIYRPSDPLMYDGALTRYVKNEINIMLNADLNIIVNQEGLDLYKRKIDNFESIVKYEMLSNGVDIESYEKNYERPEILNINNTVLYVGAWEVEWNLIIEASVKLSDFNFIVVCPNFPDKNILDSIKTFKNIFYIPGVAPSDVPKWITNCDVVMVPYVTDFYKNRPLGITAKYYQAMAAKKPIVSYCDTPKLSDIGVAVTYSYEDFIDKVKSAMNKKSCTYSFDLIDRKWNKITEKFIALLKEN